jgi:hypothetical protein
MFDTFAPGDIVTVTSTAGIGRTGFVLAMAAAALAQDQTVLLVDGEGITPDRLGALRAHPGFGYGEALNMETAASLARAAVKRGVDVIIIDNVDRLPAVGSRVGSAAVSLMRLVSFIAGRRGKRPIAFFTTQVRQRPTIPVQVIEEGTPPSKINVQVSLERDTFSNTVKATVCRKVDGIKQTTTTIRPVRLYTSGLEVPHALG